MSNKGKIKESKELLYSLAQTATEKIYENKFLVQEIDALKKNIELIKDFLVKYSTINSNTLKKY